MKNILTLLLGLMLVTSGYAQTYKIQKVKRTYSGAVQRGLTRRNMDTYPANSSGNTAFFVSVNAGCQSITLSSGTVTAIASSCQSATVAASSAYYANGFGEGSVAQLMQTAPFIPATNSVNNWPSTNQSRQTLDNGIIRMGIGKAIGGAIMDLGLSGGGKNWVNNNWGGESSSAYGGDPQTNNRPDLGRSGGWSMYGTPGHGFTYTFPNGSVGTTAEYFDTGFNTVHGGTVHGDHNDVQWFERRTVAGYGEVMYCKTQLKIWALHNVTVPVYYHCWWWLDGHSVRYYSIIDNQRNDTQMTYQGSQQEGPFMYTSAELWHHKAYIGDSPFTGGGLTDINKNSPGTGLGFDDIYNTSEGWIASLNDAGNGIIMVPQHNTRFHGGQFTDWSGDETTNASSYINSSQMMNFDVNIATAFGGYIYAGNINEFRTWINGTTIQRPAFSWTFGQNNTCGWWSSNAAAKFINNQYSLNIGHGRMGDPGTSEANNIVRFGQLSSPFGAWKASEIPVVYVKFKITNGITNLHLTWKKAGSDNSAGFSKSFTASNTTDVQTVAIAMSGVANWNNIIANIAIGLDDIHTNTDEGAQFVPIYIGKNQP